jgi:hypothetical protein
VRTWDVFIGRFTLRGADENQVVIPADAIASIETALKREPLTPELHWLRLLHRHDAQGDALSEALLDNEPWPAGTQALNVIDWPTTVGYTASCFMMLDVRDY